MQYLSKITNSHSCGHDNISSSTLKCIAHEICECLTLIINQSITTGIFPENLKIAKVVPIYKKDDQFQIKNYISSTCDFENIRKCNAQPIDGIFHIT